MLLLNKKLLSEYANKNSTEPEIEKLLNMICDKMMPASVQPQCTEFVNQYGPVVISLIVNGIKPDQICTFIGLCPKSALDLLLPPPPIHIPRKEVDEKQQQHFFDEEHLFKHRSREEAAEERRKQEMEIVKPANNQTLQCSLCLYVAELVDTQLKQNKTEEQITREVELVCNLFPSDLRQQVNHQIHIYLSSYNLLNFFFFVLLVQVVLGRIHALYFATDCGRVGRRKRLCGAQDLQKAGRERHLSSHVRQQTTHQELDHQNFIDSK